MAPPSPDYGTHPAPGYGTLLPNYTDLNPSTFGVWFFLFWAGLLFVVIALPWALNAWRKGNVLPILMLGGGLVCSISEPMWDHLGHLRWAEELPDAFFNFGLDVPILIPPCYALFAGLEAYWVYVMITRGVSRQQFFSLFMAIAISDAIMEHPGLLLGVYEYYGNGGPQPFDFGNKFPLYWSAINAAGFVTGGVILSWAWPQIKDSWRKIYVLGIPLVGMAMGYGACAVPVFLGINSNLPMALQWVCGGITIAMAVGYIKVIATLVSVEQPDSEWTLWGLFKARFMLPSQRDRYYGSAAKPVVQASSTTPPS